MRNFCPEMLEVEKGCCSSKSTSVKSKAAVVESEASPFSTKGNKCSHHGGEICFYGDSQDKKHPTSKTKIVSLKGNGSKSSNANGNRPQGKAKGQLHQLQDPSSLAKSHYNVINVEAGVTHTKNVPHKGGINWRGLNGAVPPPEKGEGPRDTQTKLGNHGVMKRGEGRYYNPDPLYQLIGRVNEAKVRINGCEVTGLIDSGGKHFTNFKKFCRKYWVCHVDNCDSCWKLRGLGGLMSHI